MASDLDEFFAKRDRKKKSGKSKSKQSVQDKQSTIAISNISEEPTQQPVSEPVTAHDDEWEDCQEDALLKSSRTIAGLTESTDNENVGNDDSALLQGGVIEEENEFADFLVERSESNIGPWRNMESANANPPTSASAPIKNTSAPATKQSYVPPSLRNSMANVNKRRVQAQTLPDVNNETAFPSLEVSANMASAPKNKDISNFHSPRLTTSRSSDTSTTPLATSNRYNVFTK